jgi:4-diphosphocytidyl-2-C-methyl-D-erythritol kinase
MTPPADTLHILSPAKINLRLEILKKRPDGYHEIKTIFQKVSLYDDITISRIAQDNISISVDDPSVPSDTSNLAYKAATLLMRDQKIAAGLAITIKKRIPAGAGLGGGSSNAAATLLGLNRLFKLNLPPEHLQQLAVQLGADVPFFISTAGTACACGIGEILTPMQAPKVFWILIVFPNISISTSWAYTTYSQYKLLTKIKNNIIYDNSFEDALSIARNLYNDFESVVYPAHPHIKTLRDGLLESGACGALLSGSGSSVFGIFSSRDSCERAQERLSHMLDYRLFAVHSL